MNNHDDATFTFTLTRPVEVRGKAYSAVTVRRPLVRDLIAAERQPGNTASDAALLAICAGVPFGDLGYFDAGDFRSLLIRAGDLGFFGGGEDEAPPPKTTPPGASSGASTPGPGGGSKSS